jgi:uncharacterized iron-regulated membrane protein
MKLVRTVLFWAHLATGLIAGLAIGIMCVTGAALAFEQELVAWGERDARRVAVPTDGSAPLALDDLQRKLRAAQPEFRPTQITVLNDPGTAVIFAAGRDAGFYADPYTGEVRAPASTRVRAFMHTMVDWHRYLAQAGDRRPTGKLINGICNLAFFGLAVTGLYLWWPRSLSWRSVKAVAVFNWRLVGKARDFNWHNAIGLWCAPILIVLTLTAVPISFRWGGNLIYRLTGEEIPAQAGPGASAAPAVEVPRPAPDAAPVAQAAILAQVQADFPQWEQITFRPGAPGRPVSVTVREKGSWPRTATTTLTINPYTGAVLSRSGYADLGPARQIRSWTRFLHTGQALGWPGQLVAGLACVGGAFLVYTGFALSFRRFFGRKPAPDAPVPPT